MTSILLQEVLTARGCPHGATQKHDFPTNPYTGAAYEAATSEPPGRHDSSSENGAPFLARPHKHPQFCLKVGGREKTKQ